MATASRRKAPRRTAQRILEVTLELFNRFGEPNVSTTLISAELRISPGNLYYHYPAKDALVDALVERYEEAMRELLEAADGISDVEHAWFWVHSMFERIWDHRFIYRDLNDLLSRNRKLETHFKAILRGKQHALQHLLTALASGGGKALHETDARSVATSMVVVLTHWLSFEYERNPRQALEPEVAGAALMRGAYHVLVLIGPYLDGDARAHLRSLAASYVASGD